jgi:hypothetical protein
MVKINRDSREQHILTATDHKLLHPQLRRFLILQQQYLEALEAGNTQEALQVLRSQLAPLATSAGPAAAQQLHQLAGGSAWPGGNA